MQLKTKENVVLSRLQNVIDDYEALILNHLTPKMRKKNTKKRRIFIQKLYPIGYKFWNKLSYLHIDYVLFQ